MYDSSYAHSDDLESRFHRVSKAVCRFGAHCNRLDGNVASSCALASLAHRRLVAATISVSLILARVCKLSTFVMVG
jgi:hypothetical protein